MMDDGDFAQLMSDVLGFLNSKDARDARSLLRIGLSLQMTALLHWGDDNRSEVADWAKKQLDQAVMVMGHVGAKQ